MKKLYLLGGCFLMLAEACLSQTWNGSVSSNWNTAANWTPATVPGVGSNVAINNSGTAYQPKLNSDISIATLNLSAGALLLNGFTLTCSGHASLTGDSLLNGKIIANTFDNVSNMHLGGKIVLEKAGPSNEFWGGNNKFYGDSLIVVWRLGVLHLESDVSSPDSIFGNLIVQLADTYSVGFSHSSHLYVQSDMILDNRGNGTFFLNASNNTVIGGNLVGQNFSSATPDFLLKNVTTLGSKADGPFYSHTVDIDNCRFNGNFTMVADSNVNINVVNSAFTGADNLLQAGSLSIHDNLFGKTGIGTTILRAAHNVSVNVFVRDGNNRFLGDLQWETNALYPGGVTLQQTFYGADSCWGNMTYMLKGNSALTTNGNGKSYVAGNVVIDGQGAKKWVEFTGGNNVSFQIDGSFTAKNFTAFSEPGVGTTNIYLRNLTAAGTDTCGTFYCYTGDINNCNFNGNFTLIADSSKGFAVNNSSFNGADNFFQAGTFDFQNNRIGQKGTGTSIWRAAHNVPANVFVRDGNNKFYGDMEWQTYAAAPAGITIQQTFYGPDTCLGNVKYILGGNSALTTNGNGKSYVAGNVVIDGQGFRKWVEFTGGNDVSYNVGGNFTFKNFSPDSEPGVGTTNVHLRNLTVKGSSAIGTFYCYTGDITNCSFKGSIKLVADSAQPFYLANSTFAGANNTFQGGNLDIQGSRFGKVGSSTTLFHLAHNVAAEVFARDGNNKFLGDVRWEAVALSKGSFLLQQTFYGPDTCMQNLTVDLSGASSINLGGNNLYIGKNLSLQNNGSGVIVHNNGASALYFTGTDTSSYAFSGSGSSPSIVNVNLNRRGGLRLLSPLTCTGLTLNRGIVLTTATNLLQLPDGGLVVGGSDSSYVDGPMKKAGNTTFTFPLGRNNSFAPISISAPALTSDAFTAQYFDHPANSDGFDSSHHDATLDHISRNEYWTLIRSAGASFVNVILSWKAARSGVVDNLSDLRVTHWNGLSWKDEGNGGTTGDVSEGSIQSLKTIDAFSPFTLASSTNLNPLPVSFLYFRVQQTLAGSVLLQWQTANATNQDHFEVERGSDGVTWQLLSNMQPLVAGKYFYTDENPQAGINFYRVKQVDKNGGYRYSVVCTVLFQNSDEVYTWPIPATDQLHVQLPFSNSIIEIINAEGRVLSSRLVPETNVSLTTSQLVGGTYILRIRVGNKTYVKRFLKI